MMRHFARQHASLWSTIDDIVSRSTGGNEKAQRKIADRITRAGARNAHLTPGKRGQFELVFYDFSGWDPRLDIEIQANDEVPERPWIACNLIILSSQGRGRNLIEGKSRPVVLISHHAISRTAQRLGLRTNNHLMIAVKAIWNTTIKLINEKRSKAWSDVPAAGWRAPLDDKSVVVLQRHYRREKILVAATVI
jgi:hypothetical protein